MKALLSDKWEIERELVLKKGKVYILKNEKLKLEVIWLHHDMPVARHENK